MSFILDALRKSEAARRRSEAPDLFANMPQAQPSLQARPRWPWWALGAALIVALTLAVWLLTQRAQAPVAAAPAIEDAGATAASRPSVDEVATAPAAATSAQTGPAQAKPASEPPAPPAQTIAERPATIAPPPAATAAAQPPAPSNTAPPAAALPAPPPVAAPAAPPAGDRILSPAELEPTLRRELPALKLSMHLWNETPARRFIILDGQRLKEGDVLGEGVSGDIVVERIDRDGAVLAWRGLRLRIE